MKNKKVISIIISMLMLIIFASGNSVTALAATSFSNGVLFEEKDIKTLVKVNNKLKAEDNNNYKATAMGGLSVGTESNELYVIKSNSNEKEALLYYYSDIYNATVRKSPKVFVFKDSLLGHANAMAVDSNYLYITMWQKNGAEKRNILRINRSKLAKLKNGAIVSISKNKIYKKIEPLSSKKDSKGVNKAYGKSITAITTYSESKTETKFIIGYDTKNNSRELKYTHATLKGTKFIVSEEEKDIFHITLPKTYSFDGFLQKENTMQDIFYHKNYGLFIGVWHPDEYDKDKKEKDCPELNNNQTGNSIFKINIINGGTKMINVKVPDGKGGYKKNSNGKYITTEKEYAKLTQQEKGYTYGSAYYTYSGNDIFTINIDMWQDYNKFEVESIAFITKKADKKTDTFRFIFSANIADETDTSDYDIIAEVSNASKYIKKIA